MTPRTWAVARRYFFPVFGLGVALFALGNRRLGAGVLALAVSILYFFRDPERAPEGGYDARTIYAPADGFVAEVEETEDETLGRAVRISTFLNLHNVHVNRSPVGGEILDMKTVEGGYAPALFGGSGENYRLRTSVAGKLGPVVIVQKAGAIARRITPWISPGDEIGVGERIGVIHFGSRTDVLFPAGTAIPLVSRGEKVRAGLTEIARYGSTR